MASLERPLSWADPSPTPTPGPSSAPPLEPPASSAIPELARFPQEIGWHAGLLVLATMAILLAVLCVVFWPRPAGTSTRQRPSAVAPPASQRCTTGDAILATITQQEQGGRWNIAAANAQTGLSLPALCPAARRAFAGLAIADGLEALFNQRFLPDDVAGQRTALDTYRTLQRLATVNRITFPSSLQIADRAYQSGQWLLTKAALEDAWDEGTFAQSDQTLVQLYTSTTYNLGSYWTRSADPRVHAAGLNLLAISNALDRCYRVGSGAAAMALQHLFGPNQRRWPAPAPAPASSPLLSQCGRQG